MSHEIRNKGKLWLSLTKSWSSYEGNGNALEALETLGFNETQLDQLP
jgi:hypothetical protein